MHQFTDDAQEQDSTTERSPRDKTVAYLRSTSVGLDVVFAISIADKAGEIDSSDNHQWKSIKNMLIKALGKRDAEIALRKIKGFYQSSDSSSVNWR